MIDPLLDEDPGVRIRRSPLDATHGVPGDGAAILRTPDALLGSRGLRRALHGASGPGPMPGNDLDRLVAASGEAPVRGVTGPHGMALVLAGVIREGRPPLRVGYLRVPVPRMRRLEVGAGGLRIDPVAREGADGPAWAPLRELVAADELDLVFLASVPDSIAVPAPSGWTVVEGPTRPRWIASFVGEDGSRRLPIGGATRRKRRQRAAKLARELGPLDLRVHERPGQVAELLADAATVTRRSWHEAIDAGVTDDDAWRRRSLAASLAGTLRAYVLRAGDRPLGYVWGTVRRGPRGATFFHEATAMDRDLERLAPGSVLLWMAMEDLLAAGIDRVDFGHGDSAYKRDWATHRIDERHVRLWTDRARGRLGARLDRAAEAASAVGRRGAARLGGIDRVRSAWRRRLRTDDAS